VRCRDSLKTALQSLQQARMAAATAAGDELVSLELRQALRALQTVLGEVYTDDVLDHIFSHFCIGK
jgi:tRNA modification GTPase